eukprot:s1128_g9.t1
MMLLRCTLTEGGCPAADEYKKGRQGDAPVRTSSVGTVTNGLQTGRGFVNLQRHTRRRFLACCRQEEIDAARISTCSKVAGDPRGKAVTVAIESFYLSLGERARAVVRL